MFPTLQFNLKGLIPYNHYMIEMNMVLSSDNQWKFQNGRWVPSGQMDSHIPCGNRIHICPLIYPDLRLVK